VKGRWGETSAARGESSRRAESCRERNAVARNLERRRCRGVLPFGEVRTTAHPPWPRHVADSVERNPDSGRLGELIVEHSPPRRPRRDQRRESPDISSSSPAPSTLSAGSRGIPTQAAPVGSGARKVRYFMEDGLTTLPALRLPSARSPQLMGKPRLLAASQSRRIVARRRRELLIAGQSRPPKNGSPTTQRLARRREGQVQGSIKAKARADSDRRMIGAFVVQRHDPHPSTRFERSVGGRPHRSGLAACAARRNRCKVQARDPSKTRRVPGCLSPARYKSCGD